MAAQGIWPRHHASSQYCVHWAACVKTNISGPPDLVLHLAVIVGPVHRLSTVRIHDFMDYIMDRATD